MKKKHRLPRLLMKITILVVIFVGVATFFVGIGPIINQTVDRQASWRAFSWRAQLYLRKATGNVPDLSWAELWEMTRQPGGFSLEYMFTHGTSLEGALANPYTGTEDLEAGQRIFRGTLRGVSWR